jgi:small subunit ribosomal protein S21
MIAPSVLEAATQTHNNFFLPLYCQNPETPIFAAQNKKYVMPLIISLKENESIDKALKRFKKKFEKTGVLKELRARTSFEKPSVTRRSQIIRAAYRQKMYTDQNY